MSHKKHIFSFFMLLIFFLSSLSAQVSITSSNIAPHQSAMLDVQSNGKGVLFPRMTSAQRRAIFNPAAGLVVYDFEKEALYLFNGTIWKAIAQAELSAITTATGIDAADGLSGDQLGVNVKISGNYAIAGAALDDVGSNTDQGSVYVYKFENSAWTQVQKITSNDGAAGDNFGSCVAIDSNFLLVGSAYTDLGENINQGSVYVFKLENGVWIQKQKLSGSNSSSGDIFGGYVTMRKGLAVISAQLDDIGTATDAGSAYIFRLNDTTGIWNEIQKIYPTDGSSGDNFANSTYISGDKIILSAIYDDVNNTYRRGSAYIFSLQNNVWVQSAKLLAADGASNDNFGINASIQGDFALIGASGADGVNTNQGACYLFKYEVGVWVQKQKFFAGDPLVNGFFGTSVSLKENYAVVGAHGINSLQGGVYIFQLNPVTNSMSQFQKTTAIDASPNDYFGFSSDISNGNIIVGAWGKNGQRGKVYFKTID